jgi:hypothetical protein
VWDWFNAKEAKSFGLALARQFASSAPRVPNYGEKAFDAKTNKLLKQLAEQALRFKQQQALNGYKKAQLGNAFRWGLVDAGIDADYAAKLTQWLMLQLR